MQIPAMGASEPMFNVPRVVLLLAGLMVGMQLIQILLPSEESLQFLLALAFIPARYSGAAQELPGGYLAAVTLFRDLHARAFRLGASPRQSLWMAAFGSPVAKRLGDWRFLVVFRPLRHCRGRHPPRLSLRRNDPRCRGVGGHRGANGRRLEVCLRWPTG